MPEPTSTGAEGEPNPSGSGPDPSSHGVPAGYVPKAELEAAEARRRSLQSQLDQAKGSSSKMESEIAEIKAQLAGLNLDPSRIADEFTARFNQQQALSAEKQTLREEFKLARPEVFDATYATPEEMRVAVEASQKKEGEYAESIRESVEKKYLAELKEKHGIDLAPAPQTPADPNAGGTGEITAADIQAMSLDELRAVPDEVFEKLLK